MNYKKIAMFVGGVLFGTAGVTAFSGKDAKSAYTHCTAAALRVKDCVMKRAAVVKENCGDIVEDAKDINDKRYEEQELKKLEEARAIIEEYENREKEVVEEVEETVEAAEEA